MSRRCLADSSPEFVVECAATGTAELQISAAAPACASMSGDAYDDVSLLADCLRHLAQDMQQIRDGL